MRTHPFPIRWARSSTTPRSSRASTSRPSSPTSTALMTDSQDWWPADFGHYGPPLHPHGLARAGTYRTHDGRGGAGAGKQRFAPLNSWPDNANLDKARRLLWPIKQKYGDKLSWADLLVLAGNVALETMGFKTFGFAGGRVDVWEPEESTGVPRATWLGDERYSGERELSKPARRGADGPHLRQPGRPERQPRPARRGARHPRNLRPHGDERRGDRRAHRRRPHLRQDPRRRRRQRRSARSPRAPASRSRASAGTAGTAPAIGGDAITSGLEVTWTTTPTQWSNNFFENLFGFDWELTKSPAGAQPVDAKDGAGAGPSPTRTTSEASRADDADDRPRAPLDPAYEKISRRFLENPDEFADAFARAWFKLTHRDMGPRARYLGPRGAGRRADLAGPGPGRRPRADRRRGHRGAQGEDPRLRPDRSRTGLDGLGLGVDLPRLGQARRRQRRAHPPRCRRRTGRSNQPAELAKVLATARGDPEGVQRRPDRRQEGLAGRPDRPRRRRGDREGRPRTAATPSTVPFTPGRTDASQEQTDVDVLRGAGAGRRRLPQLRCAASRSCARGAAGRPCAAAEPDRAGDDGPGRRPARPRRQRRRLDARRLHRPAGDADATTSSSTCSTWRTTWKPSSQRGIYSKAATADRRAEVDRDPRRPGLRLALAAARARRGLRPADAQGEVRRRTSSPPGTR